MENFVILDNVEHADLKVTHQYGEEFGTRTNQIRAFVTEFEDLVCILGLDAEENLFLDNKSWTGRYVPAALRRGPFRISLQQNSGGETTPNISVNLEDARVGTKTGTALFEPNGGLSPYLSQIANTLNIIHIGMNKEEAFFAELESLHLLEEITVQVKLSEDKGYAIPNVFTVSKERLLNLGAASLEKAHQSGLLELCHWVISSLRNTDHLLERKLYQSDLQTA